MASHNVMMTRSDSSFLITHNSQFKALCIFAFCILSFLKGDKKIGTPYKINEWYWLIDYIYYIGAYPPPTFRFVCKMQKCKTYALSTDLQWFKRLQTLHFTLQSFAKTRILPKKRLFCAFRKCPNGVLVRWKTRVKRISRCQNLHFSHVSQTYGLFLENFAHFCIKNHLSFWNTAH